MLFRSAVMLLLIFSFATVNASSLNRRAPTKDDGKKFAKVLACAVPKVDLKAAPQGQQADSAVLTAFDECAAPIYSPSSCASSAKPNSKRFQKVVDCATMKINEKSPQGQEPVAAVIAYDGCAQTIYSSCSPTG